MRRLFLGIEIPRQIKAEIAVVQTQLRQDGVVARWTHPSLFHITVVFLGQVDEDIASSVQDAAAFVAAHTAPFMAGVTDVGLFRRNRIMWIGLAIEAQQRLADLQKRLLRPLDELTDIGFDDRPFRGHITLARQLNLRTYDALTKMPAVPQLEWTVSRLALFESVREAGQLTYPVRETFDFLT